MNTFDRSKDKCNPPNICVVIPFQLSHYSYSITEFINVAHTSYPSVNCRGRKEKMNLSNIVYG